MAMLNNQMVYSNSSGFGNQQSIVIGIYVPLTSGKLTGCYGKPTILNG